MQRLIAEQTSQAARPGDDTVSLRYQP